MDEPRNGPQAPLLPLNQVIAIDSVMLLGIAVLCWYALHVAGFAPPLPLLAPRETVVQMEQQQMVYILAVIGLMEYGTLIAFFPLLSKRCREVYGQAGKPLFLRIFWAGSIWIYIIVLWFTLHPMAGMNQ